MLRCIAILLLTCVACTSGSPGAGDGGTTGANGQPCSQYQLCVQYGDVFNCDCGGATGVPACPASVNPDESCSATFKGGCMGCSQGADFTCTCTDAGLVGLDGGTIWSCIGGGQACR